MKGVSQGRTSHAIERRGFCYGSFPEALDTGNSNRVLGLFRGLAKGVK